MFRFVILFAVYYDNGSYQMLTANTKARSYSECMSIGLQVKTSALQYSKVRDKVKRMDVYCTDAKKIGRTKRSVRLPITASIPPQIP